MTHYELVKEMQIEKMAELVCPVNADMLGVKCRNAPKDCYQCALEWLKGEAGEKEEG